MAISRAGRRPRHHTQAKRENADLGKGDRPLRAAGSRVAISGGRATAPGTTRRQQRLFACEVAVDLVTYAADGAHPRDSGDEDARAPVISRSTLKP